MKKLKGKGSNSTYKIGVIGGMGSLATVEFYNRVVLNTDAKSDIDHNNMVILNHATLPDRTYCICYDQHERFLDEVKEDFDILNNIKVDAIAIPCNTSHYYYEEFKNFTDIRIINMIDETMKEISKRGYRKARLFSTVGTYFSGIYHKYADEYGVEIVDISDEKKAEVAGIIKYIKGSNKPEYQAAIFNKMVSSLCDDKTVGIIACTELSLIKISEENAGNVIDALDVLVTETLKV